MPFIVIPELCAIAIGYRNQRMVAERVLPTTAPVSTVSFRYRRFALENNFRVPETAVGRLSRPNVADHIPFRELTAATEDHALDLPLPKQDEEEAAQAKYDVRGRMAEQLTNIMLLRREARTAQLVMDPAQYGDKNKEIVAAKDKWDGKDSDPLAQIESIRDSQIMTPNKMIIGRKAYTALRKNPNLVKAWHGNQGDRGRIPLADLQDMLELEEIIVGEGWIDVAKPGQAPKMQRVWGNSALLFHQNAMADTRSGISFGYTVPHGARYGGEIDDPDMGGRGGKRIRVGEQLCELIAAPDLAYLMQDVVA